MTTYKAIPGYENYLIGTDSSVWSTRTSVPKNIKPQLQNSGYYYVTLYNQFGQKKYLIHRLVAEVFIGKSDLCINHKDENKLNNNLDNLEYCTYEYNNNYGSHNIKVGISHKKAIRQLSLDGSLIKRWDSAIDAERGLNIQSRNIVKVLKGQRKTAGGFIWEYE